MGQDQVMEPDRSVLRRSWRPAAHFSDAEQVSGTLRQGGHELDEAIRWQPIVRGHAGGSPCGICGLRPGERRRHRDGQVERHITGLRVRRDDVARKCDGCDAGARRHRPERTADQRQPCASAEQGERRGKPARRLGRRRGCTPSLVGGSMDRFEPRRERRSRCEGTPLAPCAARTAFS